MGKITTTEVKKNMMLSVSAQIVSLFVSLLMNLALPKFISEYQYAYWQTYLLYVGYVGIFHFGLLDGIILRYSQYDYDNLDKMRIRSQFWMIACISVASSILCMVISSTFAKGETRIALFIVSLAIVTRNIYNYTSYTFQMTNRIKLYAKMVIGFRLFNGVCVIALLLIHCNKFYYLCLIDICSDLFGVVISFKENRELYIGKLECIRDMCAESWRNISVGIMLTLSNWTSFLLAGVPRFAIKQHWGDMVFGKVSFSFSVINLFLTFITAISVVLFPSLKRIDEQKLPEIYVKLNKGLHMMLYAVMVFYYPGCIILRLWLPNYSQSLICLGILLPIIIFSTKINLLSNNYFKAYRMERVLLITNVVSVMLSIALAFMSSVLFDNLTIMLISAVLGYVLCAMMAEIILSQKMEIRCTRMIITELLFTAIFIMLSQVENGLSGIIYLTVVTIYLYINRNEVKMILGERKNGK